MNPVTSPKSKNKLPAGTQAQTATVSNKMKEITLIPRVSEKAYAQSQAAGIKTYIFEVPLSANKHTVARAISVQYEVTVTEVRTTRLKGKTKQSYRKGGRPISGVRSDIKKAYVTLKAGDTLPLFAEEAAEEAKAAEAEAKAAKAGANKTDEKTDQPKRRLSLKRNKKESK